MIGYKGTGWGAVRRQVFYNGKWYFVHKTRYSKSWFCAQPSFWPKNRSCVYDFGNVYSPVIVVYS